MLSESKVVELLASYYAGDIRIDYLTGKGGEVGLRILPDVCEGAITPHRGKLPIINGKFVESESVHSLVVIHLAEDRWPGNLSQGRTLQHSPSTFALKLLDQTKLEGNDGFEVVTRLQGKFGVICEHRLETFKEKAGFKVSTKFVNQGDRPLTLLLLSSFSLSGISPFTADDSSERLRLHRFRSSWSQEGRHITDDFESLHLEPSWTGYPPLSERFGQIGSLPTRGFFPTAAIEDKEMGVLWGAQLAYNGSWQMEVFRTRDHAALTGGLADFEYGHWKKSIQPGEFFEAPTAFITTVRGNIDVLSSRLVEMQDTVALPDPKVEENLPIVFNEYCSTWGEPTEKSIEDQIDFLEGSPVKYLVIDAGWSAKKEGVAEQISNGDWQIERRKFPNGFKRLNEYARSKGLIPGIWFEFEVCTEGADVFLKSDHQLTRFGDVLEVDKRRFWDFRDPWVTSYLQERVIEFLRENDFGYMKVDYNENIGVGCDSIDGLGEGLRQQMEGVYNFFKKIREELPDLVLENCASGGHRLEPLMVGVSSMSSFSDAHENQEIPLIAANLHRLVPLKKSQIWSVLRAGDSLQRIQYSLSAAFLGRMCLSGDLQSLNFAQSQLLSDAMTLYRKVWPLIKEGRSRLIRDTNTSLRNPKGSQMLVRFSNDESQAIVVWHIFDFPVSDFVKYTLPKRKWRFSDCFGDDNAISLADGFVELKATESWTGGVALLSAVVATDTTLSLEQQESVVSS